MRCTACGKKCGETDLGRPRYSRHVYGTIGEPRCSAKCTEEPVQWLELQQTLMAMGTAVLSVRTDRSEHAVQAASRIGDAIRREATVHTVMTDLQVGQMRLAVLRALWPDHAVWCRRFEWPANAGATCTCNGPVP